jgi:co-chaperonin GroES (HSP10)
MTDGINIPNPVVPIPGDEKQGSPSVIVYLDNNDDDLVRCVDCAHPVKGVSYRGLYRGNPVFRCMIDPEDFVGKVLSAGVKVGKVIIVQKWRSGAKTVDGYLPMFVRCIKCHKEMLIRHSFSRTGEHLCDSCLSAVIEEPVKGDDMGLKDVEDFEGSVEDNTTEDKNEGESVLPDVWTADDVCQHITLFEDQILVEHIAPPTRSKGGIHLPRGAEMVANLENQLYKVLVVGPGRNLGTEREKKPRVNVGDIAIVRRTAAISFCQEQRDYYIISDSDVVGVISGVSVESDNPE